MAKISLKTLVAVLFLGIFSVGTVQAGLHDLTVNGTVIDMDALKQQANPSAFPLKLDASKLTINDIDDEDRDDLHDGDVHYGFDWYVNNVPGKTRKWIVQFNGPVQDSNKSALTGFGCKIYDYLPDNSFIVGMNESQRSSVLQFTSVNYVARFLPKYKVASRLKDANGNIISDSTTVKLVVQLDSPVPDESKKTLRTLKKWFLNATILDVSNDFVRLSVQRSKIIKIANRENVLWIDAYNDMQLQNKDAAWVTQSFAFPSSPLIWGKGILGTGQIVGIGDTGLDYDMPWFKDTTYVAAGPKHRKVVGYDGTFGDTLDAAHGHGTHIAGTIAGDKENSVLNSDYTVNSNFDGVAPKARLFIQDLQSGAAGQLVSLPSDLGEYLQKSYDNGARIQNNSWGGDNRSYGAFALTIDRFAWKHKDFLSLCANGNSGPALNTVVNPATAKNIISVGATLNGNAAGTLAQFSSRGPTADGRIKPTLVAPGDGVTAGTGIVSADSDGNLSSNNSGTRVMNGTSTSTAVLSGASALVRQYFKDGFYPSGLAARENTIDPSAALIKAVLISSAVNLSNMGQTFPFNDQGWGRVDLEKALHFDKDAVTLNVVDNKTGLKTNETWSQQYYSTGSQNMKITLVWTDYPGSMGAAKALVNDLDLTVTAPNGTVYKGNNITGGVSIAGGNPDRLNVEEQVLINNSAIGNYTVTVAGYNVPQGPQPFAIVINGASSLTPNAFVNFTKTSINIDDVAEINVGDVRMNTSSTVCDALPVTMWSTRDPSKTITLKETGNNTSLFSAKVRVLRTAPVPYNPATDLPYILVNDTNDSVRASYTYQTNTITANAAVIDMIPPVISHVTDLSTFGVINVTDATATITWHTNEPANSAVRFSQSYGRDSNDILVSSILTPTDSQMVTDHSITLLNLDEGTTYYFDIISADVANNTATDKPSAISNFFTTGNVPPTLVINETIDPITNLAFTTYFDNCVISGTATDASGVQRIEIKVNNSWVTLNTSRAPGSNVLNNYFEYQVSLPNFDPTANTFDIRATDMHNNQTTQTVAIKRLQSPDLIMNALSAPGLVATGGTLAITNTAKNIGLGDAKAFTVNFYLSPDTTITTDDLFVGSRTVTALAAGAVSADVTSVTLPLAAQGNYYLGAIADSESVQYESNETNNSLAMPTMITIGGYDLTTTAVTGPQTGAAGGTVNVSAVVANSGPDSVGAFNVGIYLTKATSVSPADTLLGYFPVTSLAAGATSTVTGTVTIPASTASGSYSLAAIADYDNKITELDENNNGYVGTTITMALPDLTTTAVNGVLANGATAALPGDTFTANYTVKCLGGSAGPSTVGFYLSANSQAPTSGTFIGSAPVNGLAPGATASGSLQLTIPQSMTTGTYYLCAVADSANAITEADETNNALVGNQITLANADIIMGAITSPANGKTGLPINVTASVSSNAPIAARFRVGFYLSTDQTITTADTLLGYVYVTSLTANTPYSASASVTIPASTTNGTYYLGAIADDGNVIAEPNKSNNTGMAPGTITVTGAEITMVSATFPQSLTVGSTFSIANTVSVAANSGYGTFKVGMYLSTSAVFSSATATLIGYRTVVGLAPGASDAGNTTVVIPSGLQPGTYYLMAVADYDNKIVELNEQDNVLVSTPITLGSYDLAMSSVSGPTSALPGASINVTTKVTAGAAAVGSFKVGIYLSTDTSINSAEDTLIGYRMVSGLAANASDTAVTTVTVPANIPNNVYYIGAIADSDNQISELNKSNNALAGNQITVISLVSGVDLMTTAVTNPTAALSGDSVQVSATVANYGLTKSDGFYVYYYLSADKNISSNSTYLGYKYFGGIASAAASTGSVTVKIPYDLASGTYYVGAIADNDRNIIESNKTNNTLAGAVPIVITGAELAVTSVTGPASAQTGTSISVTDTSITTAGASPGYYVYLYLAKSSTTVTKDDVYLGYHYSKGLSISGNNTYSTTVKIPVDLAPGTYYLAAIADPDNSIREANKADNAFAGAMIQVIGPDLTFSSVSAPAAARTGDTISVSATAQTLAGGSPGFYAAFYLAKTSTVSTSDMYLGYRYVGTLVPGGSSAMTVSVKIPIDLTPGTYYIGAIADYDSSVKDSNRGNNAVTGNTIVINGPDLTFSSITASSPALSGGTMTVTDTVVTTDGGSPGFYVAYYLSKDQTVMTNDIYLGYRYASSLQPLGSNTANSSFKLPNDIPPGTYYIGAIADYDNSTKDVNRGNNAVAGNMVTVVGPDLTWSSVSGPANGMTGGTIDLTSTATTLAGGSSGFYAAYYLSKDNIITVDDIYLGYRYVGTLAPGGSNTATTTLKIPTGLDGGIYYIGAIADTDRSVPDSNPTNNAIAGNQINILAPDLTVSSVSGPTTAKPGDTIYIANSIANSGGGAAGFYVGLYLAKTQQVSVYDTYLGYRYIGSLTAGGTNDASTMVKIPVGTAPGLYYIGAVADTNFDVKESNKNNNSLAGTQIQILAP